MQNQMRFNLDIPLAASNIAARYHKPSPIIVERGGGISRVREFNGPVIHEGRQSAHSSITEDRMALAVRLAKRDFKKQKEQPSRARTPSPKASGSKVTKGGTQIVYTRAAQERAQRLEKKRADRNHLKVREQGWNAGIATTRSHTPPRSSQTNLPATTNSPPTRDTDRYPVSRGIPSEDPNAEIARLQREMEGYLQHIQVIEQKAMIDDTSAQPPKTRKKDGYLSDEEDPARRAVRQEEQATRSARQIYNLRQQVRALQDQITSRGNVKHTKKSQIMLRLAAAHRGAVRAIQGFVTQQLPLQDLRRGLPEGYQELSLLIRQLAMLSTQIRTEKDQSSVQADLVQMLDRVEELNKAWCAERVAGEEEEERRRKSPLGGQQKPAINAPQVQRQNIQTKRNFGKENKPKGLLKKHFFKANKGAHRSQRKVTPERQQVLQAGIQALLRDNALPKRPPAVAWDITADDSAVSEPANTSLILPKGLQYKRERALKSVALDVLDSHFADPTLSSSQKAVQQTEEYPRREPWKPGGSASNKSPSRNRSRQRSSSRDGNQSRPRSLSRDGNKAKERSRSMSPKSKHRAFLVQDMDTELMQELFPEGVDGQRSRGRSASPRSQRQSPTRSPATRSRYDGHRLQSRLERLQRNVKDATMVKERDVEVSQINMRQLLAEQAVQKGELNGEMLTEMLLNDLLYDTASELQSLEEGEGAGLEAAALQNNPTLENMYQRLEQMELEQLNIRQRWGTIHFEDERSSHVRTRQMERPQGLVAMEITRRAPSQSVGAQSSRAFDKPTDGPIVFTKSAPPVTYQHISKPLETGEDSEVYNSAALANPRFQYKMKLKISEATVKSIHSNLEKYERNLKKNSHQLQGNFDPWRLVEEVSDQILSECLKEIEHELDDIGENIVHQVCKSEFAIPESSHVPPSRTYPQPSVQDSQYEAEDEVVEEDIDKVYSESGANIYQIGDIQDLVANVRASDDRSLPHSRKEDSQLKSSEKPSKKEVTFDQEVTYDQESDYEDDDEEGSFNRGVVFDAAELDAVMDDGGPQDSARSVEEQYEEEEYEEDDDEDDDEEEEDEDVEQVSLIDSDDLQYSTDEA
ncbi:protein moonraker-like isoform X2 [Dreissena polymorpha]|uniref:Uncharacterized protein n=1 Tax=Dreissena polymorpha TaxID=45954 RepID=A0A9D4S1C8_DREPO|nr:protein moonraker-like isoform X2 [Dreissena polymorpha]KAH3886232.1 hypothetical protein DPMN_010233 [Dreissena polymorpha]